MFAVYSSIGNNLTTNSSTVQVRVVVSGPYGFFGTNNNSA
jgi:hypothetical protein